MKPNLSVTEREHLISRHRKEKNGKVRDRIKAVLAYDDGYSYSEIAKILLLDDETIRRHIEDYFLKQKLKPENGGSQSYLKIADSNKLKAHLQEKTYRYVKDICAYVKQTFGVYYSISGMTQWLHSNGFSYKKPHAVPAKANKEAQGKFVSYYHALKEKAGQNEPIYFMDSVHPHHQTQLAYGWILKGTQKLMPTTGRQYHLNFIGGICLEGHRVAYQQTEKITADTVALFLSTLRKQNPGQHKLHVIWDNAGPHRDKAVQVFANSLAIELHYLPPYSPNLNPIERLWKIMHEKVTYNTYYETFAEFTEATLNFFKTIGRQKILLRSRITDNFQILHSPLFAS
jgi:transposase